MSNFYKIWEDLGENNPSLPRWVVESTAHEETSKPRFGMSSDFAGGPEGRKLPTKTSWEEYGNRQSLMWSMRRLEDRREIWTVPWRTCENNGKHWFWKLHDHICILQTVLWRSHGGKIVVGLERQVMNLNLESLGHSMIFIPVIKYGKKCRTKEERIEMRLGDTWNTWRGSILSVNH